MGERDMRVASGCVALCVLLALFCVGGMAIYRYIPLPITVTVGQ